LNVSAEASFYFESSTSPRLVSTHPLYPCIFFLKMSSKNPNTFNGNPPKYLNDFSKALAGEVRILLAEVGKLRDERRALQYEIAELMSVKSKHGSGGEYAPEWRPKPEEPPPPAPAPPSPEEGPPAPARPAWRVVNKRPERREKPHGKAPAAPAPAPAALPAPPPPVIPEGPAWAQWRPNPLLSPAPILATPEVPLPSTPLTHPVGLFGPPTPPPNK